ncbi:MAG: small subunit ribosomal protein S16 [Parcubacteria group bacterium Gr01-1014_18]|nr:MAG: small subunit ribosomal protein S16 [Parcubacteria group bacterium Greene0416_36]TSC81046.1 MAG: small subunit ribosomal protein S16 [Parcubacteria group bacterium Gr01-1014_18]TSC98968.1 MAG: small subunit ribosomal protein S16 [Parcubacteria group bacterium Greene1014_20]TSD06740.1 MAG: small subunit ribosomal protein S16 [Parcubacteria group bacterium Greene0714_2]
MLCIKLSRRGKNKQPTYRLVVTEKQRDPFGDVLETLGNYNPRAKGTQYSLDAERITYWISKGAQPSDTVHNLLVTAGIIKEKKRNVSSLTKAIREERKKVADAEAAAKKAAAAPKAEAVKPEEKKDEAPKA